MPGGPGQPGPLRRLPGYTTLTAAVLVKKSIDNRLFFDYLLKILPNKAFLINFDKRSRYVNAPNIDFFNYVLFKFKHAAYHIR